MERESEDYMTRSGTWHSWIYPKHPKFFINESKRIFGSCLSLRSIDSFHLSCILQHETILFRKILLWDQISWLFEVLRSLRRIPHTSQFQRLTVDTSITRTPSQSKPVTPQQRNIYPIYQETNGARGRRTVEVK